MDSEKEKEKEAPWSLKVRRQERGESKLLLGKIGAHCQP